jgi:uncharacterized protein involved in exopolysaccharide biosynthesis
MNIAPFIAAKTLSLEDIPDSGSSGFGEWMWLAGALAGLILLLFIWAVFLRDRFTRAAYRNGRRKKPIAYQSMNSTTNPIPEPAQTSPSAQNPPSFPVHLAFMVLALFVVGATVVTFLLEPTYLSATKIEVHREGSDVSDGRQIDSRISGGPARDFNFVQNECEVIQSEAILTNAINDLKLQEKWGKKYGRAGSMNTQTVLKLLRQRLGVAPKRNTQIIEISYISSFGGTDPEPSKAEARDIANKIADCYRTYRLGLRRKLSEERIRSLEKSMAALEQQQQGANNFEVQRASARLEIQRTLELRILQEKIELDLPKDYLLRVIEPAELALRPFSPKWGLNIGFGFMLGGLAGLFMSGLVFLLQRRAYSRMTDTVPRGRIPPWVRTRLHAVVAAVVSFTLIVHLCLQPDTAMALLPILFLLMFGGIACAYIELATFRRDPQEPPQLPETERLSNPSAPVC